MAVISTRYFSQLIKNFNNLYIVLEHVRVNSKFPDKYNMPGQIPKCPDKFGMSGQIQNGQMNSKCPAEFKISGQNQYIRTNSKCQSKFKMS